MPVPKLGVARQRLDTKTLGYTLVPLDSHDAPACAFPHGRRPAAHARELGGEEEPTAAARDRVGRGKDSTPEVLWASAPTAGPELADGSATASLSGSRAPSVVHGQCEAASPAEGGEADAEAEPGEVESMGVGADAEVEVQVEMTSDEEEALMRSSNPMSKGDAGEGTMAETETERAAAEVKVSVAAGAGAGAAQAAAAAAEAEAEERAKASPPKVTAPVAANTATVLEEESEGLEEEADLLGSQTGSASGDHLEDVAVQAEVAKAHEMREPPRPPEVRCTVSKDVSSDIEMTEAPPPSMPDQGVASAAVHMADEPPCPVTQRFKLLLSRPAAQTGEPGWCVVHDLEKRRYESGFLPQLHIGEQPLDLPAESALKAEYSKEYKRHQESVRFNDPLMRELAVLLLEANEAIPWTCVKSTFSNNSFVAVVKGEDEKDQRVGLQASASLASKLLALEGNLKSNVRGEAFARESWRLKVQAHADNKGDVKPDLSRRSRRQQPPPSDAAKRNGAALAVTELMSLTWEFLTSLAWHDMKMD
eukprot:scaffold2973_cov114-Isochrysis_galbana.AAC.5